MNYNNYTLNEWGSPFMPFLMSVDVDGLGPAIWESQAYSSPPKHGAAIVNKAELY